MLRDFRNATSAEDFREGQIQAYPRALGHPQLRLSSEFFASKLLKETLTGDEKQNAFPITLLHRGVPGEGWELPCPVGQPSLAGTVTAGWASGVLPTLHILPALVFSCPAVSWDNNLLLWWGLRPRSGSMAGCWCSCPALPGDLHPGRDRVGMHGLRGDLGHLELGSVRVRQSGSSKRPY